MYLDTDVLLAALKVDGWLDSAVDTAEIPAPITSAATVIEILYVMEAEWSRARLSRIDEEIEAEGVELVSLTPDDVDAAGRLRATDDRVGIFDSIHLGTALTRDETIVSTDTLYPEIESVPHVDPRDLDPGPR